MPIRKHPDSGIYWVDIRAPGQPRVRRSTGTKIRKEAEEFHDKLKAQLWRVSRLGEEPDRTLDEATLAMLKLSEGQSDYETKVRHVEYWRAKLGGTTPIRSLTSSAIMLALPTHTARRHGKPKPLSAASKNRYLSTIRRSLTLAAKWDWINKVPYLPIYEEPKVRIRWEPQEVIHALITALSLDWMRDVCLFAVATGMREEEILSLPPRQINLANCTAWVESADAKSGYSRTIPLNDDAVSVVKRRLALMKHAPHEQKYVFTRADHGLKISQVDARCLRRACAAVGIEDFTFHDFRHTWASWHVQNGTPLLVLQQLGGWETIEMVQKYAHLAPSHLKAHAGAVTFWTQPSLKTTTPPEREALVA